MKKIHLSDVCRRLAERKRSRIDLFLSFGCLILSLGILLTSITQAWIRRNWSTTISEDNIKIETSGSLAFLLDGKTTAENSISILSQLGMTDFVFKPVSNYSGKSDDFFTLNKQDKAYQHLMQKEPITPAGWTEIGMTNGYIEFHFTLLGDSFVEKEGSEEQSTREYVFLQDDSFFSACNEEDITDVFDPAYALRISITAGKNDPIMIKKKVADVDQIWHTGINNQKNGDDWIANGQKYYADDGVTEAETFTYSGETYNVKGDYYEIDELKDHFGGDKVKDGYIDPNECICFFTQNERVEVTVRIWVEGTDPCCTSQLSGKKLKLFLNFGAANCYTEPTEIGGKTYYKMVNRVAPTE